MAAPAGDATALPKAAADPAAARDAAGGASAVLAGPVVRSLLAEDPFLLYLDETDDRYHVRHGAGSELAVAKGRSLPEPYPIQRPRLLQKAYRWLWLAGLGMLLAGLGAMVFASLAAIAALALNFQPISRNDRIRSLVVLTLAGGLWLGGLLLGAILLMHLI